MGNSLGVSFKGLTETLGFVSTVLSSKTVEDKMKNVIFSVKESGVEVIGYSPLIFTRVQLETLPENPYVGEDWVFQIKQGELTKFISSFNSLSKTKVERVFFETNKNKIRMVIHEDAISQEDERLNQVSRFDLDDIAIIKSVAIEISREFPESSESVMDLNFYLDMLLPVMVDMTSNMASKLNFGKDFVFVVGTAVNAFMPNKLGTAFNDITLGYSAVAYLKKLCDLAESLECVQMDGYLCVKVGKVVTFIRHQPVKVKIETYLERKNSDNGVILDRLYLKDVLRRMGNTSVNAEASIDGENIHVSNESFKQDIPINISKGDTAGVNFKFPVANFSKCILGSDSILPDEVFLYFVRAGNTYSIYFMDKSNSWFSIIQVR